MPAFAGMTVKNPQLLVYFWKDIIGAKDFQCGPIEWVAGLGIRLTSGSSLNRLRT